MWITPIYWWSEKEKNNMRRSITCLRGGFFLWGGAVVWVVAFLSMGCTHTPKKEHTLFDLLDADSTHITFNNKLSYAEQFNIFTYRNFYTGGGVAVGDINNDGLPDIF